MGDAGSPSAGLGVATGEDSCADGVVAVVSEDVLPGGDDPIFVVSDEVVGDTGSRVMRGPSGMAFALPLSGFGGGSIAVRFGKVDEIVGLDQVASDGDGQWMGWSEAKKRSRS